MTSRKPQDQLSASAQLFLQEAAEMGKNVLFHTLDITQQQSVLEFVDWLKLHVGFLDILINNAAIAHAMIDWDLVARNNIDIRLIVAHPTWTEGMLSEKYELARECIETNYYGSKRLIKAILPLLRPSSYKPRIVNVSSLYGLLCFVRDEELRAQLNDTAGLTEQKIDDVLAMFLEDIKYEKCMKKWPLKHPSYSISKVVLNAYTRLLALQLGDEACVNSAHPGYVITDMTFGTGDLSPAEGAANLVDVALLRPPAPSGRNFKEREDVGF